MKILDATPFKFNSRVGKYTAEYRYAFSGVLFSVYVTVILTYPYQHKKQG